MRLLWTKIARADRISIREYIWKDSPRAAINLDEQLSHRAALLATAPLSGRVGRVPNTRELVIRPNYILVYDIHEDNVRILRVLHARKEWSDVEP